MKEDYYNASVSPGCVEIEAAVYIAVKGSGRPGTDDFYEKKKALILLGRKLQFLIAAESTSSVYPIVEIFYWFDTSRFGHVAIADFYWTVPLEELEWRMCIRLKDDVDEFAVDTILEDNKKSGANFAGFFEVFRYAAGWSVQVLHEGSFADESRTMKLLGGFAELKGLVNHGMHHEIHLTHWEKGQNQDNQKTILRDPVLLT